MSPSVDSPPCAQSVIELIDEVTRLRGRLFVANKRAHGAAEMGGLQWLVLSAVVGARSAPTVARIGRSLGHPRQSIQRLSDELVGRGLIAQQNNPEHARARLLVPTPVGLALHQQQTRRSLHWAERIAGDLDPLLLRQTIDALRLLRSRIETDYKTHDAQTANPVGEKEFHP